MATLPVAAVRKQIESGTPDSVYLLVGEDEIEKSAVAAEFAEIVDEGLRAFNVERIHAGEWTTGDKLSDGVAGVIAAARTLPMMAPRRVVIVLQAEALLTPRRDSEAAARALEDLEAFVQNPPAEAVLVLASSALDGRLRIAKTLQKHATVVLCGVIEDVATAQRWIRERVAAQGMDIEAEAARIVAIRAGFPLRPDPKAPGGDVARLRREVDHLLLYALGQKRITADDARAVAGPAALQDHWGMSNAIDAGQTGEALRQLTLLLENGVKSEMILGQIRSVVARGQFPGATGGLTDAVDALFRTDVDLKRSAGDPRVLLERLVVELCGARRGVRRT